MMLKIYSVVVGTRNPHEDDPKDKGSCEEGFYQVDGDTLTMCDAGGVPLRSSNGERIVAKLHAGDIARQVAARLVLARWRNERDTGEGVADFNRPLYQSARDYGGY